MVKIVKKINNTFFVTKNDFNVTFLLQVPYLWVDLPKYMSYGALGSTIGHEILHGFDRTCAETPEAKWWTDESKETFTAKEECILNQYGTGKALLYSKRTIRENIPDHGGIKLAYKAYRKSFSIKNKCSV